MKYYKRLRFLFSIALIIAIIVTQPAFAASLPTVSESGYDDKKGIELEGEWLFYPNQFYTASDILAHIDKGKRVSIPSTYQDTIKYTDGYGTFAVEVKVPRELVGKIAAIRVPYQHAAMEIYIDQIKVLSAGKIAKQEDGYLKMQSGPFSHFEVKQESFYVIIHFSSFGILKSGFSSPINIGDPHEMMKLKQRDFYLVVFLLGILILVSLFCIFIGFVDKQQRMLILFGFCSFVVMLRCTITAPFLYRELIIPFEITPSLAIRSEYLLSLLIGYLFMSYLIQLYRPLFNNKVLNINKIIYIVTAIILFVLPSDYVQIVFTIFVTIQAALISYLLKVLFTAYKLKLQFALTNVISVIFLACSVVFEVLSAYNIIPSGPYVLLMLTLISVILAYEFGKFYVQQLKKVNDLNQQLFIMNNSLDELVQQRTDELTVLNMKLQYQATIDGLTGVYNRFYLDEKLKDYYNKARQNKESLAIVIFDIDEFKQYNDTNGHIKGDKILSEIVNIVKVNLPPNTIFSRFGGEEFVLLFYNYQRQEVEKCCETIRKKIEAANIEHTTSSFKRVTISLGAAFMDAQDYISNPIELLEYADRQLYVSKRTGKNKLTFN